MKKFRLRSKKLVICILMFILFAITSKTIDFVSVADRAIVAAMGIEYLNGEYRVSLQIIKSEAGSDKGGLGDGYYVMQYASDTVTGAVYYVGMDTGLEVSLAHCSTLILSTTMLDDNLPSVLAALVNNFKLPDKSLMFATEDSPVKYLDVDLPMTPLTAFYLKRAGSNHEDDFNFTKLTVKDYLVDVHSKSGVSAMAFLEKMPEQDLGDESERGAPAPQGSSNAGDTAGASEGEVAFASEKNVALASEGDVAMASEGGDGSASSPDSKQSAGMVFSYRKSMLFGRDIEPTVMSETNTSAYNLFKNQQQKGSFELTLKGERLIFNMKNKRVKTKIDGETVAVEAKVKVKSLEIVTESGAAAPFDISGHNLDALADSLRRWIADAFEFGRQTGIDIFQLENKLYQKNGRGFVAADDFLDTLNFDVKVTVSIAD